MLNTSAIRADARSDDDTMKTIEKLESQFAALEQQLRRMQRMAALGTVVTMLVHEFNNLLTPLSSFCQFALQQDDPATLRAAVQRAVSSSRRMSDLSRRILGMATDERPEIDNVHVRPLIEDAAACLGRNLSRDNIALTIDVPADLTARLHEASLHQVIFNLLINARQAMLDRGGRLDIRGRPMPDGRVELTVADTGPGISPDNLNRVFEPFFTTREHDERPDRRGAGMGLYICRRLMDDMNGDIAVASTQGQGTVFTLHLPAGASTFNSRTGDRAALH